MTTLAKFFLVVPQISRVHFKVYPYHTYDLANYYPETLFNQRIKEIQTVTKCSHPATLSDYLAFLAAAMASFFLGFLAVSGYPKYFVIICFLAPLSVWIWAIWQKYTYPAKRAKFESLIHALLKSYTTSDMATHSISWLLLSTTEPNDDLGDDPDPSASVLVHLHIHIVLNDPESVPEDPLPLYIPQNENEVPPDYGLPEYEHKAIKVDKSIDMGEVTHAPVGRFCAGDVQRVLTTVPGRAGLAERDITDIGSERTGFQIESTTPRAEDAIEVVVEGDGP